MEPTIPILAVRFCLYGNANPKSESPGDGIWKPPPRSVITSEIAGAEIAEKEDRTRQFLDSEKPDTLLLTQRRNVCWITAGEADNQIVLNKDIGGASPLFTRDNKKYLVTHRSPVAHRLK